MIKGLMTATAAVALSIAVSLSAGQANAGGHGDHAGHDGHGDHAAEKAAMTAPTKDIVATAVAADDFNTLVAAVQAAGLVETLQGPGPFTVFAPTDAAFAELGEDKIADLLKPENRDTLTAILTYHVVPGKVMSADLAGKMVSPATVQGSTVDLDATGDSVKVEQATVVKADIVTSNGVIHVIDSVITP
ncbi:MAG: hypothetical protein Alpg2KO_19130 [Alphaproteobacteria bacterium]